MITSRPPVRMIDALGAYLKEIIEALVVAIIADLMYKGIKKGYTAIVPSLQKTGKRLLFNTLLLAWILKIISLERFLVTSLQWALILGGSDSRAKILSMLNN